MVRLSGVPHLHYAHSIPWAVTSAPIVAALAPGPVVARGHGPGRSFRRTHPYLGGTSIAPGAVTTAPGLSMPPPITALSPYMADDAWCT